MLDGPTRGRLLEYAEFAETLVGRGDCLGARIEYERVAHITGSPELEFTAHMRTAECLFRQQNWGEAATEFSAVASLSKPGNERNTACFMIAATHFNAGNYIRCRRILDQCEFQWMGGSGQRTVQSGTGNGEGTVSMESWLFMQALCAMARGDWDGARGRLDEVQASYPDSPRMTMAMMLKATSAGGQSLPRRNPVMASVCSAIVPGSGQVYAGNTYDGIRHFLFNGLLLYGVYHLADNENYAGTYLLAAVGLPFYMGNILGAKRSAERFNAVRRLDYLSDAITAPGY